MARCVFAEEHARFRRKRGSKKWQGGHFLRAFRGSGLRLHCSTSFRNGYAAPPIPRRLLWPTALQTAGICLFLLYYGIISANKESFR